MAPSSTAAMLLAVLVRLLAASLELPLVLVHGQGQLDPPGFISIDCGYGDGLRYQDSLSRLTYVSDAGFVDAGEGLNAAVRPPYVDRGLADRYLNVRYFPTVMGGGATRSCYTLRQVAQGSRNLVRASFYYGNYDGQSAPPAFDLHLGVNRWATVNVTSAEGVYIFEAVAVSPVDFMQVCLVNIGLGTPFISGLELRPLSATMYQEATVNQSLFLLSLSRPSARFDFNRYQFNPDYSVPPFRYPDDSYDRLWQRYGRNAAWTNINTTREVDVSNVANSFDKPSEILQNAATPVNGTTQMDFSWSSDPSLDNGNGNSTYLLFLYFAELQRVPSNGLRQFDILVDNATGNDGSSQGFTPKYLSAEVVKRTAQGPGQHSVFLVATPAATLPPILNAFEIYSVKPMTEMATNGADAKAMMTIRERYALKKNWKGDPCAPKAFAWDGLNCSYPSSGPAQIIALNLSSSGLTGTVNSSFGDLKSLQQLDLSNNSLSGPVPDFLAQMSSLSFLDLSSNILSGSVPAALLQKIQNGSLVLRIDNNINLCDNGPSTCEPKKKKRNKTLIIATVVPIAVATLLFVAGLLILHRMRNRQDTWMANNSRFISPQASSHIFENRKFTYKELKLMTANFKEEIGRGGFGSVFLGYLENGSPVAVKMRSKTSSQGAKEFLAEAQHLSRVHHKNLVSLIGYCKDKKHMALVYEYMQGGNLEDCLRGEASAATPLTWHQRLKIALNSAQGLEYLHKSCQPPLIHRDVKTKNILLSADLEAKIADFGLMKAFSDEFMTHVTTQPAGTLGYLDPEYYNTSQLSEKSDVYSFGVVLLELITGQPPAVPVSDTESIHVAQWVRQKLSEGDIASIADPRMGGMYDVNSLWKVAELALKCKEQPSRERPAMTDIVAELKESLELEVSYAMGYYSSVSTSTMNLSTTSVDLHSNEKPSDHPGQKADLELQQVDIVESATRIGPAPR